jgi:hypothetical protein
MKPQIQEPMQPRNFHQTMKIHPWIKVLPQYFSSGIYKRFRNYFWGQNKSLPLAKWANIRLNTYFVTLMRYEM